MNTNQQEEEEVCSICQDSLEKLASKFVRMTCCGKGMHKKCCDGLLARVNSSTMSDKLKNCCPLCRTKYPVIGSKENIEQIQQWVEKGKSWAQSMLGEKYYNGDGVDQSYQQAKELFELAATQGHATAQYNLGCMYDEGQGVDQSYEKAAEYWEAAARQGYVDAQFNLGALYANGQGVEQSFETARAWWMKAAEQGDENAIEGLQQLDKHEGITTSSFTPPKRCFTCDAPETPTHKLNDCLCFGAQYCNAKCQTSNWKSHKKEHHRLCKEMKLKSTEGEMKDEVVVEEEEGETKETTSADLQQEEEEEEEEEEEAKEEEKEENSTTSTCALAEEEEEEDTGEEDVKFSSEQLRAIGRPEIYTRDQLEALNLTDRQSRPDPQEGHTPWEGQFWCKSCQMYHDFDDEDEDEDEEDEEEDMCLVCIKPLQKDSTEFLHLTCCGKGIHTWCDEGINNCPLCLTEYSDIESMEDIEPLQQWVEKGKAWAQILLGQRYYDGVGVDQSYQQAIELFELAANQGEALAHTNLGFMYEKGQGVDQSYERAAEYYEAAVKQGYASAQCGLGALYANGKGVEQSFETSRKLLMKSAEQGNEGAINALQQLDKMEGRTTSSFTPPKRCFTCDAPETPTHKLNDCPCFGAQYCNAKCQRSNWKSHKIEHRRLSKELKLKNTEGEMKDDVMVVEEVEEEGETKEAASAYLQPEEEEEEDACSVCIESLQKDSTKFLRFTCCGKGIHIWCLKVTEQKNSCPLCRAKDPSSNKEQIERLRPWVEKGKAWAQKMLGDKYHDGVGVDQSYQQAKELYELAANQGEALAQTNLGFMYHKGQGVDQSNERAAEYYEAAARQGNVGAQTNLGALYCKGEGVEQSNEKAREWFMKAAEQGHESAITNLQVLDKEEGRTTPLFVPKPFECANCFRPHVPPEHKLNACNRCLRVYYCGRECQVKHWKKERNGHKKMCNKK